MGVPILALAGLAVAAYTIWRGNEAEGTPSQRRAQRASLTPYTFAGIGAAFAAGTPLVAGMGKAGGYAGGSGAAGAQAAGTAAAEAGATAPTVTAGGGAGGMYSVGGAAPTVGAPAQAGMGGASAAGNAAAAADFTYAGEAMATSGAPGKYQYLGHQIQQGFQGEGGSLAMNMASQSLQPQPQQQMGTPQPAKRQPDFSTEFYQEDDYSMALEEDVLDDSRRGSLRHTWWEA